MLISPNGIIVGLLTPAEAAKYLACSERTLRNYVAQGLPFVEPAGGHKRFRVEDLKAWVDGQVRQLSNATPNTATSSNTDSPSMGLDTGDPLVDEITRRLKGRLCGSTRPRSPESRSRKRKQSNVLPLRRT